MRIVVLSAHTSSLYWFRVDMMRSFIEKGHEVIAIGNDPVEKWENEFLEMGISYRSFSIERNSLNPIADIKSLMQLSRLFNEIKPDKVFIYQAKTIVYGSIAAKLNNITDIYLLIAGLGSILRGSGYKNAIIKQVLKLQYNVAIKISRHVFFHNNNDRDELIRMRLITQDESTVLNGSGVNTEIFIPQPLPEETSFIFIGRLIKDKGIFEYLEACRIIKVKYPNVKCLLVGPFDTNPTSLKPAELQVYIEKNIIQYFEEQRDVRPFLSKVTTLILPSYHEGRSKTILEAMAMGRSVITTDVPGCRDSIEHNVNGIIVPAKSINELADAMSKLIEEPKLNYKFGENNVREVKEKYESKIVNSEINKIMGL